VSGVGFFGIGDVKMQIGDVFSFAATVRSSARIPEAPSKPSIVRP
jgi:hypothetical protein